MSTRETTFDARVTDFERPPWLPVADLSRERAFLAELACDIIGRVVAVTDTYYLDTAQKYARAVGLMRDEDLRIGQAYREAYQAWKAVAA